MQDKFVMCLCDNYENMDHGLCKSTILLTSCSASSTFILNIINFFGLFNICQH